MRRGGRGGEERRGEGTESFTTKQEGGESRGSSFMFNHFNRKFRVGLLCAGIKKRRRKPGRKVSRDPVLVANWRRVLVLFCRLVMQVTRVTASIDFPLPPRIDLGESEQITEFPQLREPIDKESSQEKGPAESWEYIFHFFTAPSSYPLLRPRSAIYLRSLSTSREHDRDVENEKTNRGRARGGGHHRWNERSLNRELDNSVLISLPRFFFLPPFSQWYFITFPNDRARTIFENTLNVIERLLKKKKEKERNRNIFISNENWDIIRYWRMSSIVPPPYLSFLVKHFRLFEQEGKETWERETRTRRQGNIIETLRTNRVFLGRRTEKRISRKISGLIKSHDEPSRVVREELYEENERPFDFKDTHFLGGYTYSFTISLRES